MKLLLRKCLYKLLTWLMNREKLMFLLADNTERTLLGFKNGGYLYDNGWYNSVVSQNVVDLHNQPIPWVTYPFISFIEDKLMPHHQIFEYGSGNSTIYYSKKVAGVDSVENDIFWFDKIKNAMPANVNLFYSQLTPNGNYSNYPTQLNKLYDIVIVDGRDRINCCKCGFDVLKPTGVLVLDDAERTEYLEAAQFLAEKGFKRLDFWGLAPLVNYTKCTTLFYRPNNCLNI